MTNSQTSKLNMYKAVQQVCESHEALFISIPAVGSVLEELNKVIQKIKAVSVTQRINTNGITQDKNTHKQLLGELAVEVSGSVVAYAVKNKNNDLKVAVDYSLSDILRTKDIESMNCCQIILEKAQENVTELLHYGLTPDKLIALQASIEEFSDLINKRQDKKGTKVAATKDLDLLFDEADILLKDVLDRLLLSFKKSDLNFYNKYMHARQIIEIGKRSKVEETTAVK